MRMPRLVVVDDDMPLAEELAGLFSDVGYEVAGIASEGREGIDLVERTKPDVVVMDVRMEGMSGTEAAGVLRRRHPDIPVVLLSAYGDEGIVKAAREASVAAYLIKGCSAGELLSTVGTVVKESRERREEGGHELPFAASTLASMSRSGLGSTGRPPGPGRPDGCRGCSRSAGVTSPAPMRARFPHEPLDGAGPGTFTRPRRRRRREHPPGPPRAARRDAGHSLRGHRRRRPDRRRRGRRYQPDVALLDVRMPEGGGLAAALGIREVSPRTRLLAYSVASDRASVVQMLRTRGTRLRREGRTRSASSCEASALLRRRGHGPLRRPLRAPDRRDERAGPGRTPVQRRRPGPLRAHPGNCSSPAWRSRATSRSSRCERGPWPASKRSPSSRPGRRRPPRTSSGRRTVSA